MPNSWKDWLARAGLIGRKAPLKPLDPVEELGAYMDRSQQGYTLSNGQIYIHKNLILSGQDVPDLPDNLRVPGFLHASQCTLTRLPENLWVGTSLFVDLSFIGYLPASLHVGQILTIAGNRLDDWPPDLYLPGSLFLNGSKIPVLPEGMRVKGMLDLTDTPIVRLPRQLQVGGSIYPPHGLLDIQNFMADKPARLKIRYPQSQHERLALRRALEDFPDIWTVVMSMEPGAWLAIHRQDNLAEYRVKIDG